jgi:hypothetical protein
MLVLVAFGGAAALAAWLRLPAVARDTLWAEDGRNFLQGAIDSGPVNSLFIPYAGYLHTIPRMIAAVVELFPISGWAIGMTAGACIVAGVVTVTVFVATRGIIDWMPARVAIASLTVLAPLAPRRCSATPPTCTPFCCGRCSGSPSRAREPARVSSGCRSSPSSAP